MSCDGINLAPLEPPKSPEDYTAFSRAITAQIAEAMLVR